MWFAYLTRQAGDGALGVSRDYRSRLRNRQKGRRNDDAIATTGSPGSIGQKAGRAGCAVSTISTVSVIKAQ